METGKRMNVGIVTTWFERGAAYVSRQIMDALAQEHHVHIYARGERYEQDDSRWNLGNVHWGKRVYRIGSGRIDKADFQEWIADKNLDVVIFNEQRWWQPVLWAKEAGLIAGTYVDYYTPHDIRFFGVFDFLICNTRRHYQAFSWHPHAYFVPWGTDIRAFRPATEAYGVHEPLTFFHSCGFDPYRKGTDLLVAAFNTIKQETGTTLLIHTQRPLDFESQDMSQIEVIHRTVPPPGLYGLGDIYVYPSRLEGIGLTVCEALACGLPVITTDVEPMSEFVTDGVTGYLVPIEQTRPRSDGYYWPLTDVSVPALAGAMRNAWLRREALPEMKRAAREYALQQRDWSKNASLILQVIGKAEFHALGTEITHELAKYDRRGVKGRLDLLVGQPAVGSVLQGAVKAYRRWRQPELYR